MDESANGRIREWTNLRMDESTNGRIYEWTNPRMNESAKIIKNQRIPLCGISVPDKLLFPPQNEMIK
ncbi:MAG: hypothetical protein IPM91_10585 [Bacteroidetes bacterium]|nr:hypothetical protein [Bacteroidota bacterium]